MRLPQTLVSKCVPGTGLVEKWLHRRRRRKQDVDASVVVFTVVEVVDKPSLATLFHFQLNKKKFLVVFFDKMAAIIRIESESRVRIPP